MGKNVVKRAILSLWTLPSVIAVGYFAYLSAYTEILLIGSKKDLQLLQYGTKNAVRYYEAIEANFKKMGDLQKKSTRVQEIFGDYYLFRVKSGMDTGLAGKNAAASYRNAIKEMPAKAEWWTKLAYTKAVLNEFDKEFYISYERALLYGGYDFYINETLVKIGLAYWYFMNVDSRLLFKQAVINAYSFGAYPVLKLAQEYGQLRMVCIWVRNEDNLHRM